MAGLATEGFRAQLPDNPVIPANIGKVDVNSIYDSVVKGLNTANVLRVESSRQQEEDAARALATEKAQAGSVLLPKQTSVALASLDGDLLQEQNRRTQLRTLGGLTGAQQIVGAQRGYPLASETATTRLPNGDVATKKTVLAQVGDEAVPVSTDSSTGPFALMPGVPSDLRAFLAGTANMTPEQRDQALLVKYGLQARPSGAAIQYKEVVGADGITRLVAVDPRAVGAQVVGSGETYGTGVGASAPGTAAPVAQNAAVFASQPAATVAAEKATATQQAQLQADRQAKLPKAQAALASLEGKNALIDQTIEEARALVGPFTVGYGSLLDRLPTSDARALKAKIDTIRANIGFDALQEMRQNSPTGGALGSVSDYEGQNLQGTLAKLDTGLDSKEFLAALDRVQQARRGTLERIKSSYAQDFQLAKEGGLPAVPFTQGGALVQPNAATPVAPVAPTASSVDDLLKKYGN